MQMRKSNEEGHSSITLEVLRGKELLSNISKLTKLRLAIYQEYPYLYEGNSAFEESYLSLFANSNESMLIIAKDNHQIIGAISGLPLDMAQKEIREVFIQSEIEIKDYYALCDVIVLKQYRSKGVGSILCEEFLKQLQKKKRYKKLVLWQIVKAPDDPKRPKSYFSPDGFWQKLGFIKNPGLMCFLKWIEISETKESSHRFEFWLRDL